MNRTRRIVAERLVVLLGRLSVKSSLPLNAQWTITLLSVTLHVKIAAVDDPKVSAILESVRDGAEYRVTVTYAGGWEPGVKRQKLTLTTDDPKQPTITVPVQAILQGKTSALPAVETH